MRILELLELSEDVELRPRRMTGYRSCKGAILGRIRNWVVHEEARRFGRHPEQFELQQGYMSALSDLVELLQDIDREIKC